MPYKTNNHIVLFFKHSVPCRTVLNHVCYAVIPLSLNWTDARNNCVLLGGRFAEVTNSVINDDLKTFVDGKHYFNYI